MTKKVRFFSDYVPFIMFAFMLLATLRMGLGDDVSYDIVDVVKFGTFSLFIWYIVVLRSAFEKMVHGIEPETVSVGLFDEYIIRETEFRVQNKLLGACIYVALYGGIFFGINRPGVTLRDMLIFIIVALIIRVLVYVVLYIVHNRKGRSTDDYILLCTPQEV